MKPSLIVSLPYPEAVLKEARQDFEVIAAGPEAMTVEEILEIARVHQAFAILVPPSTPIRAETLRALPESVRIIATSSVGYDHLDVAAAKDRGIVMTNTPDVLTDSTADLAMMLMLTACRRGIEYDAVMRRGWERIYGQNEFLGREVSGRTLGIIGMGRIGRAIARRARGFGMQILYSNRRQLPPELEEGAEYHADHREMLRRSEILVLAAPGGPGTENLMNAEAFALLPRGAVFVNIARGSLVDEEALIQALRSGALFSAGLDVFRNEPNFDRRLAELPNVVLSPHMGSATVETRNAMGYRALMNIRAVLAGRPAPDQLPA